MSKSVIAFDIDGVLADWVSFGLPRLNELLGRDIKLDDHAYFDLHKTFKVSRTRIDKAYERLYDNFSITELAPVAGAREAVDKLHECFELYAVTARPKEFINETKYWLEKNFEKEIKLYFGCGAGKPVGGGTHSDDKITICKKIKASYLIEDNPREILKFVNSKTMPLCHAWPWNKELEEYPQIPRGDWKFLVKYILENE